MNRVHQVCPSSVDVWNVTFCDPSKYAIIHVPLPSVRRLIWSDEKKNLGEAEFYIMDIAVNAHQEIAREGSSTHSNSVKVDVSCLNDHRIITGANRNGGNCLPCPYLKFQRRRRSQGDRNGNIKKSGTPMQTTSSHAITGLWAFVIISPPNEGEFSGLRVSGTVADANRRQKKTTKTRRISAPMRFPVWGRKERRRTSKEAHTNENLLLLNRLTTLKGVLGGETQIAPDWSKHGASTCARRFSHPQSQKIICRSHTVICTSWNHEAIRQSGLMLWSSAHF